MTVDERLTMGSPRTNRAGKAAADKKGGTPAEARGTVAAGLDWGRERRG